MTYELAAQLDQAEPFAPPEDLIWDEDFIDDDVLYFLDDTYKPA